MNLQRSKFKFLDRGFEETLVCLPGWAADERIFSRLSLNYNYLFATYFSPFEFTKQLYDYLYKLSAGKVSFLGYSLGGFLAADFAQSHPEMVNELILLSIRKSYDTKVIQAIKEKLVKNQRAFLYRFYLDCFSPADREGLNWFKAHLLKDYLEVMRLEDLLTGLNYLEEARINPSLLTSIEKISIFHGEDDVIAPLEEARFLKTELKQAQFIPLPKLGHLCFLNSVFEAKCKQIGANNVIPAKAGI